MNIIIEIEKPPSKVEKILTVLIATGLVGGGLIFWITKIDWANAEPLTDSPSSLELAVIQENSLLGISNPAEPIKPAKKIKAVVTAYSSSPWETDETPYITAAGTKVREGIVANNKYSFGTRIRFPEIYGDKIFIVEDRMNQKKGFYQFDIWMKSYEEAKNFGVKIVEVEILEN